MAKTEKSNNGSTSGSDQTKVNPFANAKTITAPSAEKTEVSNTTTPDLTATGTNEPNVNVGIEENTSTAPHVEEEGVRVVFTSRGTVTTPSLSILEDGRMHQGALPLGSRIKEEDILIPDSAYFQRMYALPDRNYDRNFFPNKEESTDAVVTSEEGGSNG